MTSNRPGTVTDETTDWQEAVQLPAFRALMAAKKRLLVPMVATYLVVFMGTTLLAGYWKPLMTTKVLGSFNVAYLLVLGIYLMCWIMALVYVRIANRDFDTLASHAIEQHQRARVAA